MLEENLKQLGLSDKEAKTYLASLEMGSTSVQEIAKKSGLKRPTTYFAIEQLIKRGLMSSFRKSLPAGRQGKKRFFSAESPERLVSLIAFQKKKAQALEEGLQRVLPELNNAFNLTGEKPKVRFFEGKEGIKAIQEDILKTEDKIIENIYPRDDFIKIFSEAERKEYIAKLRRKRIKIRTIYTSKSPAQLIQNPYAERKFVPCEEFPFSSDIVIYGDKVAIGTYKGKLIGIIIESKEIAETLRLVFNLAWKSVGS